jgi:hypothetical protein
MQTTVTRGKSKNATRKLGPQLLLRFRSDKHHAMVKQCAENAGLSLNAWIGQATIRIARKELAEASSFEMVEAS